MPKLVDHDRRRIELIEATWRTIARNGWNAATMAAIAAEAGFANGALRPYFATKEELFAAAFDHIYTRTGERTAQATAGQHGLPALRSWCQQILPLEATRRDEARVIISFWPEAMTSPALAERHEVAMRSWRDEMQHYLTEARDAGEVDSDLTDEQIVGHLLTALLGAQVTRTLLPGLETTRTLLDQLDGYLAQLRPATPRAGRR